MSAPALKKIPTLELVFRFMVGPPGLEPGTKRFFWSNRLTLRCSKEFLWVAKRDLAIPLDHFHIRHNVMKS